MGWLAFAGLAGAAGLLLWRLAYARALWMFAAAALMLGAAGYAWQGQPRLPSAPARPAADAPAVDEDRIALRRAMFGQFDGDSAYALAGDGMLRAGLPDAAVRAVLGGIDRHPDSLMLWAELGSTLAIRDRGLSPAALFAFRRAAAFNPRHPAPPFFLGLAQVRAGQFAAARTSWARALAVTPPGVAYRADMAARLALLDRLLATTR